MRPLSSESHATTVCWCTVSAGNSEWEMARIPHGIQLLNFTIGRSQRDCKLLSCLVTDDVNETSKVTANAEGRILWSRIAIVSTSAGSSLRTRASDGRNSFSLETYPSIVLPKFDNPIAVLLKTASLSPQNESPGKRARRPRSIRV